jgi:hypothetical protein
MFGPKIKNALDNEEFYKMRSLVFNSLSQPSKKFEDASFVISNILVILYKYNIIWVQNIQT